MAVSPWFFDRGQTGLVVGMVSVGVWMAIAIPLIIGFKLRRYWGVVMFFYVGLFCAVALPAVLILIAGLLLATPHRFTAAYGEAWFAVGLVFMLPFWPMLVRALRLKYWQPWTRSSEWEIGDERIANWVFDVANVPRRPEIGLKPVPRANLKAGRRRRP